VSALDFEGGIGLTEVQEVAQESNFALQFTVAHIVEKETGVFRLQFTIPLPEVTQVAGSSS
jgi:hypothetical protein